MKRTDSKTWGCARRRFFALTDHSNAVPGVFWAAWLALAAAGCRGEKEPVQLEQLPYTKQSHHAELRAELSRLKAEDATPQLLDQVPEAEGGGTTKDRAAQLVEQLNAIYAAQKVRLTLQQIEVFYPPHEFQFDPIKFERALASQARCGAQLRGYRELFSRPDFRFDISLAEGLLADLSALDHAQLAHQLEAISAADELAAGSPAAAMPSLRNMFAIDTALAAVANVAARSTAAQLRAQAFAVVEALVKHPKCTDETRRELLKIVDQQLEDWTPDRVAWIGDRALGLHAYELVRNGQLLSLLTIQEIQKLERENNLKAFDTAVLKSLDNDQWFYLKTMRRIIDACDQPYYERKSLFDEINQQVEELWDTPRCPIFAANVLLPNIAAVQRQLAIDRARCEAWDIALHAAIGAPVDALDINPVTGQPYNLVRELDELLVRNLTGQRDEQAEVRVPLKP